ncbi:uncharacterized protein [Panulirus ornatus]|uniref:uncharacterized protein isoform X2 n=1 Tax=Panulirus ornatus TaxID=150431 RepID=UPI003A876DB8
MAGDAQPSSVGSRSPSQRRDPFVHPVRRQAKEVPMPCQVELIIPLSPFVFVFLLFRRRCSNMACTLLRIVQAAVNLRRRFECAIQSSFESVESGDAGEEREDKAGTFEENGQTQPDEKDMSTSEQLSQNFQLSFADPDEGIENIGEPFQADASAPKMTFIHSEDHQDAQETENGAYKDAVASSSIEIIEENGRDPETTESGNEAQTKENSAGATTTGSEEDASSSSSSAPAAAPPAVRESAQGDGVQKIPMVQVNEISGSERSSDSDSDSRCSVKSVRLRYAEAVSPSSGCKPAKLIRSDALETNAERESNNLQWILLVKESGSELVKEAERENGDSTTESEVDKSELMGYSEWLLKGRTSYEGETSSDENEVGGLMSPEMYDEDEEDDDDSENYLEDEDEVMVDESFDDSFVDDGFVSLELDEYDDDVIIEENEEDLERERMEEEMMEEMRRYMMEGAGRGGEPAEHRKLSRQYSPAVYLAGGPLPGIPESKVVPESKGVSEGKEEGGGGGGGRLRHSSSYRSGRGSSKRSLRSPPVQRQRCVQLEGGDGEEGAGAAQGRAAPRPHPPTPDHRADSRDIVLEVDPIRVTTATPSPEVPLVVVATSEGGTRTHALSRTRSRPPAGYSHSASAGEPLPRTHAYHKYGSASFDLAKPSGYEGARAAFHTTRSSFEGDRRLSMSTAGGRGTCDILPPPTCCDKSPGSARRLPSMEAGSRPCSSSSNSDRQLPESVPRAGFRRSRSERVGGSSAGTSPARSESLRVSRSRGHHQDVEMTELCSPRRLHSYDEYSSRLAAEGSGSPATVPGSGEAGGAPCSARYTWRAAGVAVRRQSSLESGELEDLMENRRHVEQRRLLLQADSTTPSDEDEEPRSKVRYNDMGSLEQVNEEMADLLDDSSVASSDNQEKIKVQCRALWQLRTTLEEEDPEEPDSDSGRMEVHSSPDHHSPGRASDLDNVTSATSHTTSFESNTDAIVGGETGVGAGVGAGEGEGVEAEVEEQQQQVIREGSHEAEVAQTPITLPSSEARRTSYRAILANRLKQLDASTRPPLSSENSFDSVDTECSSTTDLSRPEGLTTSFDSTTDCPTDSTSDTHSHRLQQMKADSGYRSLEVNNGRPPKLSKKQIHFVEDSLEVVEADLDRDRSRERHSRDHDSLLDLQEEVCDPQSKRERLRKSVAQFERRWGKSQAKKRREALREKHSSLDAGLGGSLGSVGDSLEGDATTTDELSGKRSVLARFLRTHRYPTAHYRLLQRDYSIDEKSDRLFKEFSRTEVPFEWEPVGRRGTRLYTGRRLHRHLDAEGSPRSHRRKLSPQDSIEEEDQVAAALWEGEVSRPESLAGSIGGEDIPVFAVAEEVE